MAKPNGKPSASNGKKRDTRVAPPTGGYRLSGSLDDIVKDLCEEDLYGCYQCGTCTSGCPFVEEMDLTPDEVIRKVIMNDQEVLSCKTIWLCAACFACAEHCPRDIDVTRVMEALRQILLRQNLDATDIECLREADLEDIPQMAYVSLFRKNVG